MAPTATQPLPPGADGAHITYCRLCEAQCGLIAQVADGHIVKVEPDRQHVTSEGHLCVKGPGMLHVTYDPDRVLTPLRRNGPPGSFEPVSWEEAMTDIAQRMQAVIDRHGGDSVGAYVGNPLAFATQHHTMARLFLMALGSGKMYNATHIDTGAKHLASELVFGHPFRYTFPDLERCDFLLMLGANPLVSHMSLISEPRAHKKLDEIAKRGAVVVVDPRRTETAKRFEHVAVKPDSDAWLLGGMLKTLFDEALVDTAALQRIDGWQSLRDAVTPLSLDEAASRCGVPAPQIRELARRFARARTAAAYGRVGTNRGNFSSLVSLFIEALNLVTGRFGQAGGAVIGHSAFENPEAPPMALPAYGSLRSRVGNLPLLGAATQPTGAMAGEMLTPGPGQIRAFILDGGNPVLTVPGGDATREAYESLDLLVALDLYVNESTQYAHYILPSTTFFERADITDLWSPNAPRPWLQAVDRVIPPRGQARDGVAFYNDLLQRLGRGPVLAPFKVPGGPEAPEPMQAADVLLRTGQWGDRFGQRPEGLTIEKLRTEHPHGIRLAENVDAAASWQRVRLPEQRPSLGHPLIADEIQRLRNSPPGDPAHPFKLFGRRKLRSMNSWMHNSEELVRSDVPTLLVHPEDAQALGIASGQTVRVSNPRGRIEVMAEVSADVIRGSVNYPHGWGHAAGWQHANGLAGANVNLLASDDPKDWEAVSGMCLLDGIPVAVSAL
ncbi:MAG: molybdopterin-dependent oxidoreductase [Burkholderiales bacterium]